MKLTTDLNSVFGALSSRAGWRQIVVSGVIVSSIGFSLIGCGRSDRVYQDPASGTVGIEQRALPSGLIDESSGSSAKVSLETATSSKTDLVLRLQVPSGSTDHAVLGVSNQSETKLSTLGSISLNANVAAGSASPSLAMIVDLACDSTSPNLHVLTAAWSDLAVGTADANGFSAVSAAFSDAHFKASGSAIMDENSSVLLPSNSDSSANPQSLTALLAKYPDACLRNTSVVSDDLSSTQTAAIALSLSGSGTVDLQSLTLGTQVFDSTTWGHQ